MDFLTKGKKMALEMGISQKEAKKAAEYSLAEVEKILLYAREVIDE